MSVSEREKEKERERDKEKGRERERVVHPERWTTQRVWNKEIK